MKAVQTQYNALAKVAASADSAVAKAAIDSATTVNKALDSQIAKLRDAGASYTAIIAKQKELGASAAELAAAVRRSSAEQIASMQAVRAEADKLSISQRLWGRSGRGSVAQRAGVGKHRGQRPAGRCWDRLARWRTPASRSPVGVIEGTLGDPRGDGPPSKPGARALDDRDEPRDRAPEHRAGVRHAGGRHHEGARGERDGGRRVLHPRHQSPDGRRRREQPVGAVRPRDKERGDASRRPSVPRFSGTLLGRGLHDRRPVRPRAGRSPSRSRRSRRTSRASTPRS